MLCSYTRRLHRPIAANGEKAPSVPGEAMAKFTGHQYYRNLRMKSPIVSAVFGEACIQDSAGKYFQDSGFQNTYHVLKKESYKCVKNGKCVVRRCHKFYGKGLGLSLTLDILQQTFRLMLKPTKASREHELHAHARKLRVTLL